MENQKISLHNGEAKNQEFAHHVIEDVHKYWQSLVKMEAEAGGISCVNVTIADSPFRIEAEDAEEVVAKSPAPSSGPEPEPIESDKWHFVSLQRIACRL